MYHGAERSQKVAFAMSLGTAYYQPCLAAVGWDDAVVVAVAASAVDTTLSCQERMSLRDGEQLTKAGHTETAASGIEVGSTTVAAWTECRTMAGHERPFAENVSKPVSWTAVSGNLKSVGTADDSWPLESPWFRPVLVFMLLQVHELTRHQSMRFATTFHVLQHLDVNGFRLT